MAKFKVRQIKLGDDQVVVDRELHETLNSLAGKFYTLKGYVSRKGFDYYASNHPMEREMYAVALTAYIFNRDIGLD